MMEPLTDGEPLFKLFSLAIVGAGGTGKTAVLKITEALTNYFTGAECVHKIAPSNAAARLIGGDTIHALLKLPFGNAGLQSKAGRLSSNRLQDHRRKWYPTIAVYLDEVSMISADVFLQCDIRMRQAKQNMQDIFGGLALNICGDFLQLPPVDKDGTKKSLALPLDSHSMEAEETKQSEKKKITEEGLMAENVDTSVREREKRLADNRQGRQLWESITRVVVLSVNVRAPDVLSQLQAEMRNGKISDKMWDLYTSRILETNDPRLRAPPFSNHPINFLVHRHKIRVMRSLENAREESRRLKTPLYIVQAHDAPSNSQDFSKFTDDVRKKLLKLVNPDKTKGLPSFLPLYRGMRLTLGSKDCVRFGIMKGCPVILKDIVFDESEVFSYDLIAGQEHQLDFMPVSLILQAEGVAWTLAEEDLPSDLPKDIDRRGLFQLRPHTDYIRVEVSGDFIRVRRTTFLTMPADTLTVYFAQGGSFDACVADMRRPPNLSLDKHWLACYVMLSRARSAKGLLVLRPATRAELSAAPPKYLIDEMDRLAKLEEISHAELVSYIESLTDRLQTPKNIEDLLRPEAACLEIAAVARKREKHQEECRMEAMEKKESVPSLLKTFFTEGQKRMIDMEVPLRPRLRRKTSLAEVQTGIEAQRKRLRIVDKGDDCLCPEKKNKPDTHSHDVGNPEQVNMDVANVASHGSTPSSGGSPPGQNTGTEEGSAAETLPVSVVELGSFIPDMAETLSLKHGFVQTDVNDTAKDDDLNSDTIEKDNDVSLNETREEAQGSSTVCAAAVGMTVAAGLVLSSACKGGSDPGNRKDNLNLALAAAEKRATDTSIRVLGDEGKVESTKATSEHIGTGQHECFGAKRKDQLRESLNKSRELCRNIDTVCEKTRHICVCNEKLGCSSCSRMCHKDCSSVLCAFMPCPTCQGFQVITYLGSPACLAIQASEGCHKCGKITCWSTSPLCGSESSIHVCLHHLVGNVLAETPRPFKNVASEGWGLGSCYINAAIQFVFSSSSVRSALARLVSTSAHRDVSRMQHQWRLCTLGSSSEIKLAQQESIERIDDWVWALTLAASMQGQSVMGESLSDSPLYPSLFLCISYQGRQDDPMSFLFRALDSTSSINTLCAGAFSQALLWCRKCGQNSPAGPGTERFISLQVQGHCKDVESAVLDSYFEDLDDQFQGLCCNCKTRWSYKYRPIHKLPQVLIIQIARWNCCSSIRQRSPSQMRLEQTLTLSGTTYHLCGIIYHIGDSDMAGHYVAVVRHETNKQSFVVYNDDQRQDVHSDSLLIDMFVPYCVPATLMHASALLYERQSRE